MVGGVYAVGEKPLVALENCISQLSKDSLDSSVLAHVEDNLAILINNFI